MKLLILGGYGLTGRLLARHLLEQTDVMETMGVEITSAIVPVA